MNIANTAKILRYNQDTDKVWIIIPHAGTDRKHKVFFGPTNWSGVQTNTSLQEREIGGDAAKRIGDKLKKGYEVWSGVSFDLDNCKVVIHSESEAQSTSSNPSFWLRLLTEPEPSEVDAFLQDVHDGLFQDSETAYYVKKFNDIKLVQDLRNRNYSSYYQYDESPLVPFILFSFRRRFGNDVKIVQDDNDLMPVKYEHFRSWVKSNITDNVLETVGNANWNSSDNPIYESNFKKLAIASLCIDRPIDLSQIKSDSQAAFF